jgi:hypothetical protein
VDPTLLAQQGQSPGKGGAVQESVGVLKRLDVLKPYFEELWSRFDKLKQGETIQDCRTRSEFCEKILKRSTRSVQYILYGRTTPKETPTTAGAAETVPAEESESDATESVGGTQPRKNIPLHERYRALQEKYEF